MTGKISAYFREFSVAKLFRGWDDPKTKRLAAVFGVCFVILSGTLLVSGSVRAAGMDLPSVVNQILAFFLEPIFNLVGKLLLKLIDGLIWVAGYNDFVSAPAIVVGWVVVRDVANMFFVVGMLIMAFGTILGVDDYSYKSGRLSRMLIMAVIVNFSRTICGLFIDISQVAMLTFVNGFKDAAGGNFINAFNITDMVQKQAGCTGAVDAAGTVAATLAAYGLGLVFLIIASGIVILIIAFLVSRMVTLWGLVVMSPLAYALRGMPLVATKSYFSKWWNLFVEQLTAGPVLAFFLWLALAVVGQNTVNVRGASGQAGGDIGGAIGCVKGLSTDKIMQFIIAIGMMYQGIRFAQEMAGGAGKLLPGQKFTNWAGKKLKDTAFRYSGAERVRRGAQAALAEREKAQEQRYTEKVTSTTAAFQGAFGAVDRLAVAPEGAGPLRRGLASVAGAMPGARERAALGAQEIKAAAAKEAGLVNAAKAGLTKDEAANIATGKTEALTPYQKQAAILSAVEGRSRDAVGRIADWQKDIDDADPQTRKAYAEAIKKNFADEAAAMGIKEDLAAGIRGYDRKKYQSDLNFGKISLTDASGPQMERLSGDLATSLEAEKYEKSMSEEQRAAYVTGLAAGIKDDQARLAAMPETTEEEKAAKTKAEEDAAKKRAAIMRSDFDGLAKAYGVDAAGNFASPKEEEMFRKNMGKPGAGAAAFNIKPEQIVQNGRLTKVGAAVASGLPINALDQLARKVTIEGGKKQQEMMQALVAAIKGGHAGNDKYAEAKRDRVMKDRAYRLYDGGQVRDVNAEGREKADQREAVAREKMAKLGEIKEARQEAAQRAVEIAGLEAVPGPVRNADQNLALERLKREREAALTRAGDLEKGLGEEKAGAYDATAVESAIGELAKIREDIAKNLADRSAVEARPESDWNAPGGKRLELGKLDDIGKNLQQKLDEAGGRLAKASGALEAEAKGVQALAEATAAAAEFREKSATAPASPTAVGGTAGEGGSAEMKAAAERLKQTSAALEEAARMNRDQTSQLAADWAGRLKEIKSGQAGGFDQKGTDALAAAFRQWGTDMKAAMEKQGMTLVDIAGKIAHLKTQGIDTAFLEKAIVGANAGRGQGDSAGGRKQRPRRVR